MESDKSNGPIFGGQNQSQLWEGAKGIGDSTLLGHQQRKGRKAEIVSVYQGNSRLSTKMHSTRQIYFTSLQYIEVPLVLFVRCTSAPVSLYLQKIMAPLVLAPRCTPDA
jgi:hypothetical protein